MTHISDMNSASQTLMVWTPKASADVGIYSNKRWPYAGNSRLDAIP